MTDKKQICENCKRPYPESEPSEPPPKAEKKYNEPDEFDIWEQRLKQLIEVANQPMYQKEEEMRKKQEMVKILLDEYRELYKPKLREDAYNEGKLDGAKKGEVMAHPQNCKANYDWAANDVLKELSTSPSVIEAMAKSIAHDEATLVDHVEYGIHKEADKTYREQAKRVLQTAINKFKEEQGL